jgi:PPOX class probable F420-dependent enzyme
MRAAGMGRRLACVPSPPSSRLTEDEIERLLDAWPVARLATVAPDGRPHLVPIVFARHAGRLWSPVDGKRKQGGRLARLANVAAEPRVAVLLDHYDADWRRLWWIRVDGRAELGGGDAAVEAALRAKYPQYRETPLYAGEPALLRIEPERVTSWAATSPPDLEGGELPSTAP